MTGDRPLLGPAMKMPTVYAQRTPIGEIVHLPTRIPGWELLDVFRGYPRRMADTHEGACPGRAHEG